VATTKNLKPTALYIEWVDAVASNGWEDNHKAELHPCVTMGFLIDENKEELAFLWSASQGIELPYTATMSKRKQTLQKQEKLSLLLNRIGPALL